MRSQLSRGAARTVAGVTIAGLLVCAPAASAVAPIDTTGVPKTGYPNLTLFDPLNTGNTGSSLAQTFKAPAGAAKITSFGAILGASGNAGSPAAIPYAQGAALELFAAGPDGPTGAALNTDFISIDVGSSSVRTYPVSWPVTAGNQYAVALYVPTLAVSAAVGWQNTNANPYPDGSTFGRPDLPGSPWTGDPGFDYHFRIPFDGAAGTTPTTPTTPTSPTTPSTTPAPTSPTGYGTPSLTPLPATTLALRTSAKKRGVPASLRCAAGKTPACAVAFTAPTGTRSAKVQIVRGRTVVSDGGASFAKSTKATKRTIRLKQRATASPGKYTVKLSYVNAAGKKLAQSASFTVKG